MARIVLIPAVLPEIMTGPAPRLLRVSDRHHSGRECSPRGAALGYLLMTAIGLHDVSLIMALTFRADHNWRCARARCC